MTSETNHSRFLKLLPFALLAACAPVGPNHEVPTMELPASFSQSGVSWKRQSPDSLPKPREWWKLYHDATLNSLVERSLAQNQNLAASAARLRQARALSTAARSLFLPEVNLGVSGDRSKTFFQGASSGSYINNSFSVPADMSYELDVWGKVRRQVESATASESAAQETLNAQRLSVAGEVAQTYWALRAVDADRAVLDRSRLGGEITAFVMVGLSAHLAKDARAFEAAMAAADEVRECHNVTGAVEYLLRVEVESLAQYKAFHADTLGTLPQVASITSHICLGSSKDMRA